MQTHDPDMPQTVEEGAALARSGDQIGPWKLSEPIERGEMEDVWRAQRDDGMYEQDVALNLLHTQDTAIDNRFIRERQRLAELDHPGISRLIDGGINAQGHHWMTMELVDGGPIDQWVRQKAPSHALILNVLIDLCSTVSYAHSRLVLHRDIKAANALVEKSGRVHLIDFEIAGLLDTDEFLAGALALPTAAPEQLKRERQGLGVDVFSIGLLLSQLLTGKIPSRIAIRMRPQAIFMGLRVCR